MEKEIYGYIYKITNIKNGKVYIGLTTSNFDRRYSANGEGVERVYNYYMNNKKSGSYYNEHLLRSIEKYGFEAFEVIKEFDIAYSEEELKEKEKYWIAFYKCNDINYGYNRTEGGDSGCGLLGEEHPRYKGFVVVYPDGKVSGAMDRNEVANCLNVSNYIITNLAREKTCYIGRHEHIRYIRVLHLEDYLKEREIYKSDEDFRNMCKRMVEEAKILYKEKEEEFRRKQSEASRGENNPFYGEHHSKESKKKIGEASRGRKANIKLLICIFPDGRIIKDICRKDLAKKLRVDKSLITRILQSHKPYKPTHKRLKYLDGIVIIEEKDYLNIVENKYCKLKAS